jgi:Fe-S cluster assembly protein SufD
MVNTRNMIVLGKNSKLTFLHCDDSVNHQPGFSNTVTEIFMEENSTLDLYKLQNLNDESVLLNHTFVRQHANSTLNLNVLSLNGGNIRNEIQTFLDGEGAVANLSGLYLADKKQHIDNQVYVRHNVPNCDSYELFKGILDDEATAVFNGYIFVERNAQQTNAFQKNSNILMKPSARINTMPFLEIYADDVKCSHGATVGQLDDEALFYMRQRGIPFKDARLLLLNAFTAEVSDKIDIEALRINIEDMVKRRLRGELSICDRCVLHCSRPEQPVEFDIDLSKI